MSLPRTRRQRQVDGLAASAPPDGSAPRGWARARLTLARSRELSKGDTAGFTIIEMVVAVTILTIVLAAFVQSFVSVSAATSDARLNEVATTVADSALDNARAVVPVTTLISQGSPATAPLPGVDLTATENPVVMTPQQTTLDGHVFTTTVYVGGCYLQPGGQCTTTASTATMERIIADVTWKGPSGCVGGTCSYVSATLISTGADGLLNISPPAAPGGVTVEAGDQQVLVSWTIPNSTSPITGFTVSSAPGGGGCAAAGTATGCTVSGLTNGTAYTFTVTATSSGGTSLPSGSATATPTYSVTWAAAPALSVGSSSIAVTWSAPTSPLTVTGYEATASSVTGPGTSGTCTTGGSTSCTISGLAAGTQYQVVVVAAAGSQTSNASPAGTAVTNFIWTAPTLSSPAPASNNQLIATWGSPSASVAITGYTVVASPGGATCTGTTNCTLSGLTDGTSYTVTVTAAYSGGSATSPASRAASSGYTVVWGQVSATKGSSRGTLNVSWQVPSSTTTIASYTAMAAAGKTCNPSPTTGTTCTISGLISGTSYPVTVTATSGGQSSNASPSTNGTAK